MMSVSMIKCDEIRIFLSQARAAKCQLAALQPAVTAFIISIDKDNKYRTWIHTEMHNIQTTVRYICTVSEKI